MKTFRILHPVGGAINLNMDRGLYEFELVHIVQCETIQEAFRLSQNDFSEEYANRGIRSTCVGDIIIDTDDMVHYMVSNIGFIEIPPTVAQYIDWGNHMTLQEKEEAERELAECERKMGIFMDTRPDF